MAQVPLPVPSPLVSTSLIWMVRLPQSHVIINRIPYIIQDFLGDPHVFLLSREPVWDTSRPVALMSPQGSDSSQTSPVWVTCPEAWVGRGGLASEGGNLMFFS